MHKKTESQRPRFFLSYANLAPVVYISSYNLNHIWRLTYSSFIVVMKITLQVAGYTMDNSNVSVNSKRSSFDNRHKWQLLQFSLQYQHCGVRSHDAKTTIGNWQRIPQKTHARWYSLYFNLGNDKFNEANQFCIINQNFNHLTGVKKIKSLMVC